MVNYFIKHPLHILRISEGGDVKISTKIHACVPALEIKREKKLHSPIYYQIPNGSQKIHFTRKL